MLYEYARERHCLANLVGLIASTDTMTGRPSILSIRLCHGMPAETGCPIYSCAGDDADAFRAGVALAHDAARALHGAIASLVQSDPSRWPNSSQVVSRILESQFEGASGHASFYDNGARVPFG